MKKTPNLAQLQTFVAIADFGSQEAAAAHMGFSQPTVSRLVRDLEAWLQMPLLTEDRPKQLTSDGERFVDTARDVIRRLESARVEARGSNMQKVSAKDIKV